MEPKKDSNRLWAVGLEECMDDMIAKGWSVKICDTPVPFFDVKVRCGRPTDVGHIARHTAMAPGDFAKAMAFVIMAEGDSMVDVGIDDGDELWVETCREVYDGEIVVASVDGEESGACSMISLR